MIKNIIITAVLFFHIMACSDIDKELRSSTLKNIPQSKWDSLASKKIYFGHQSVGNNILDGIKSHLKENPNISLHIANSHSPGIFNKPVFAHSPIGNNGDPKSKIDAFCSSVENGLGNTVDIAGFKFCYADFNTGTDVSNVFEYYTKRMTEIQSKFPKLKIVHFTVPIRSLQKGPKGFINKMLGREIGVTDNKVRQRFNSLMLREFDGREIFDISGLESTFPNGTRCFTLVENDSVYSMVSSYTYDGGHLSESGKYWIGLHLLKYLSELSDE